MRAERHVHVEASGELGGGVGHLAMVAGQCGIRRRGNAVALPVRCIGVTIAINAAPAARAPVPPGPGASLPPGGPTDDATPGDAGDGGRDSLAALIDRLRAPLVGAARDASELGASLIRRVATGGGIGQSIYDATWGRRHQIGFVVRHALQPAVVVDARAAQQAAERFELGTWGANGHVDDGIDAMRHSFAAATMAATLVARRGMTPEAAVAIVVDIGHAHELDGFDAHERAGGAAAGSSAMDEHNNAAGARIGAGLAVRLGNVPASGTLATALRSAAARGELVVLDGSAPRPATAADVPAPVSPARRG
ncbi:MAG: hypothetical protein JWN72_1901 [Thermoleophilia bacterium]|nr:hypothetical protein [Thermoleophilia bacterium]